ncbi:kinase-like protein [Leucogyrophana mollusca]|uniref:Kinase-like protein n=1 Tax=Leucogyrophana mollusca TaxID=85980 RepID=A0ACB8BHV1_9AGAM|nr:kinase-like protein [Leucogyrophana mollusca]
MSTDSSISRFGDALGEFETSISLVDAPGDWLRANSLQILKIASIHGFGREHDGAEIALIYPRFYAYILQLVKVSRPRLENALKTKYREWTTSADDIAQLVKYRSINDTLRIYLSRCKVHRGSHDSEHSLPQDGATGAETLLKNILKLDALCISARIWIIIKDPHRRELLQDKKELDAQSLLDLFQELLDILPLGGIRPALVRAIIKLSRNSGLYPECLVLRNLDTRGLNPVCGGSFGDICKGTLAGHAVAIKILRVFDTPAVESLIKAFSKEAVLWGQLSNPHVLPFCGVYRLPETPSRVCLVSPWMTNGNISQYLGKNAQANRLSLMLDVAQGLDYLHSFDPPVIHGDLKGANILITSESRACVADFGLCTLAEDLNVQLSPASSSSGAGSLLWLAPELLQYEGTERKRKSCATDMYSFGCVCYEIYAGRPRFSEFALPHAIMAVAQHQRPPRPDSPELDDVIWSLIEKCWDADPDCRPKANEVVQQLRSHPDIPSREEPVKDQQKDFTSRLLSTLATAPLATPVPSENSTGGPSGSYFTPRQQPNIPQYSGILSAQRSHVFAPGITQSSPATPSINESVRASVYDDEAVTFTDEDMIIAVMGPTGTGKSSFINAARRRSSARVGHTLESCTQHVRAFSCLHPDGSGRNIVLVDTPGFDDTQRTDCDVLKEIAVWLEATYKKHITLTGILYFHSISESRMRGAPIRNLSMFEELCGVGALQNVILTTTMWDEVPIELGNRREDQLRTQFWKPFMDHGSRVTRFSSTFQSAWEIIDKFHTADRQPIQLQKEMVDEGKPLSETSAYTVLVRWWTQLVVKFQDLIRRSVGSPQDRAAMHRQLSIAQKQKRALTRRFSVRSGNRGQSSQPQ